VIYGFWTARPILVIYVQILSLIAYPVLHQQYAAFVEMDTIPIRIIHLFAPNAKTKWHAVTPVLRP
jgi:hypothetical protein